MLMDNKEGMPDEIRIGAMTQNLNQIINFHNHVRGFFNDNLSSSQCDEALSKGDKNWLKLEYDTHLPNQLRKSVFLMMFSHLEEHLYLSWCEHGRIESEKNGRHDGIKKFKTLLNNINIDTNENKDYEFIVDAYKVRNSFIHAAGRVDIIKKPQEIENVVANYKDCFEIRNKRIYVTSDGISKLNRSVAKFSEQVTRAARR